MRGVPLRTLLLTCALALGAWACGSRSTLPLDDGAPRRTAVEPPSCTPSPDARALLADHDLWWSLVGFGPDVYATLLETKPGASDFALTAIDKCTGARRAVAEIVPRSASMPPITRGPDGLYFVASLYPASEIYRVPPTGPVEKVGATVQDIIGLAVDAEHFYVVAYDEESFVFTLRAVSRVGGESVILSPGPVNLANPIVDESDVYFGTATGLARVSTSGGPVVALSDVAQPCRGDDRAGGLVMDETNVYWRSLDGHLWRTAKADGTTLSLATLGGDDACGAVALDHQRVYVGSSAGAIAGLPKAGGAAEYWLDTSHGVGGVVVDGGSVYWAELGYAVMKQDL